MYLSTISAFTVTFSPYFIMIIYHIKIFKYFKYHEHSLTPACKRVQTDLNRTLLAQAIIPILSAFLPMGIHFISTISSFDLVFTSFISGMLYSWIPVGNVIRILIFITAYRQMLKQLMSHMKLRFFRALSIPRKTPTVPQ